MMLKRAMMEQAHNYATKKTIVIEVAKAAITTTTKTFGLVHLAQQLQALRAQQRRDEGIQKDPWVTLPLAYETPKKR
jgi:hypothetical protein